jgi:sugar phosphate isomerase/epimerase
MGRVIERRKFLKTVGAGVVASACHSVSSSSLAHADDHTDLSKMPRLQAGCCAYSFRQKLTTGEMTMEDFIAKAVEMQVDAVDMTVYYLKSTDAAYLESLRYLAYKNAVALSGAACGSSLVQADAAKRADVLSDVKKWIDVADRLGASHLRIFAGKLPDGVAMQEATTWVVEGMKTSCDYAASKGIVLGIEDHFGVTQSADVCLEIMHRVDSPYARINLDITHFIPSQTQDPYAQIEACIPYATVSHIRDRFDDGTPIDMDRVWSMYARAGHRGYMSIEYEGNAKIGEEPPSTGLPKLTAKVRALCQKYSTV